MPGSVSRRSVLGAISTAPLAPAVGSMLPTAADSAMPRAELFTKVTLQVGLAEQSPGQRRVAPILGGTSQGGHFDGAVSIGRVEWQRDGAGGVTSILAQFTITAADSRCVHVRDEITIAGCVSPACAGVLVTTPELQFSDPHPDLPESVVWLGRLDASRFAEGSVELSVFRVL
jgi:hypothetical protein